MTLLFLFLVVAVADGKGSLERGVFPTKGQNTFGRKFCKGPILTTLAKS